MLPNRKTRVEGKEQTTFLGMERRRNSVICQMKGKITKLFLISFLLLYIDVSGTYSGAIRIGECIIQYRSFYVEIGLD